MSMRCTLEMKQTFECGVCRQLWFSEQAKATRALGRMVGAVDFGLCPCCGQEVRDFKDAGYRSRVRRFVNSLEVSR